ncbi:MAG: hypothetical protein ACLPQS_07575 [Acidimicrobiales bacterium]
MSEWFSIEVLDAAFSARSWVEAHGDAIVQAGLGEGALNWEWHHHRWGSLIEIEFADEEQFERFRIHPAVEAALEAVPDRVNGLLIHRGRGGSSGTRRPRRPLPMAGSGAVALPEPEEAAEEWWDRSDLVSLTAAPEPAGRLSA